MKLGEQIITLRHVFIMPVPGKFVIRVGRLIAAKWAKVFSVRITHANVFPVAYSGCCLGYGVRVTVPSGAHVPNYLNSTQLGHAAAPVMFA